MTDKEITDAYSDEQFEFVLDLMNKASACYDKTESHANLSITMSDLKVPLRVDDKQLFFLAMRLMPNVLNYLVNILPQLFYPYLVAYLQDLSDEERTMTVNDLYEICQTLDSQD